MVFVLDLVLTIRSGPLWTWGVGRSPGSQWVVGSCHLLAVCGQVEQAWD